MKILVLGSGGVGGFFGALLARAGELVWFVARGTHLAAMKKFGLRIRSTAGEWTLPAGTMTDDPTEAGTADLVLVCVKTYDTEQAVKRVIPTLASHSVILTLQNGIDNGDALRRIITAGQVCEGAAYVSARITAPGEITESGGFYRIVYGCTDKSVGKETATIATMFARAGIKTDLRQDIQNELWRKLAFITSMGSITALTRLNHGELLASPETMEIVFAAMKETEAVAAAKGISFEPLVPEKVLEGLARFDSGTRSSMYFDLINRKPLEIEALNGTIVRLGKELNVPTPIHQTIYASLLAHHRLHLSLRST